MSTKIDTEKWLSEIGEDHKLKHNYDRTIYTKARDKIEIGCIKHGTYFWQVAYSHKNGTGCPLCANEKGGNSQRTTQDDFVKASLSVDNKNYDHSLVVYVNSTTKVDIICNKTDHGVFSMLPLNRLRGQSCSKCADEGRRQKVMKTQELFLSQCAALNKHNLTFEDVVYKGDKVKVVINCKDHGPFKMVPSNLLSGQNCPSCAKNGYQTNKPGYLYILTDNVTTKVGITNRKPALRAKEVKRSGGPKLDVIASYYFQDGQLAWNLEKAVHAELAPNYASPDATFDGSTECFLNVDIPALLAFVSPLAVSPEIV